MRRSSSSYIAAFGLLIIFSIVVLVSIGKALLFIGREEWLLSGSRLAQRQSTITFTIPWHGKILDEHEALIKVESTTSSSSVPTVYSSYNHGPSDFLPSRPTTSEPFSTSSIRNTYVSTLPPPTETSDVDCTDTETIASTPCPHCEPEEVQTGLPETLGYVAPSQSTVPSILAAPTLTSASYNGMAAMPLFATPMGYMCRPQLVTTQSALGCSVCTTVTETWHSTDYSCTATAISSVAATTVTVMVTPSSPLAMPASITSARINTTSGNSVHFYSPCSSESGTLPVAGPPLQTVPPSPFSFSNSTPSLHNLFPTLKTSSTAVATTSTHPCPNAGYSCSECLGGWFCPPIQTPAMSCPCGYGWACADCVGGWYCVPGPTSTVMSIVTSAVPIPGHLTSVAISSSLTSFGSITKSTSTTMVTCADGSFVASLGVCVVGATTTSGQPISRDTFTSTIDILGGVPPSVIVGTSKSGAIPIVSDAFSVAEHITTHAASSSLTTNTISTITTLVPVFPLVSPDVSDSRVRRMKRRALQQDENHITDIYHTDRETG